jgi:hypothetical protein
MKQLFRCDYCDKTGTAEEILEHEKTCLWNHIKRSCWTCKHAEKLVMNITCNGGVDLEKGKYMEGCRNYEWDERDHTKTTPNIFGSIF